MGEQADLIVDQMIDGWFGHSHRSKRSAKGAVITTEQLRQLTTSHLEQLVSKAVTNGTRDRIKGELKRRRDVVAKGEMLLRKLRGSE